MPLLTFSPFRQKYSYGGATAYSTVVYECAPGFSLKLRFQASSRHVWFKLLTACCDAHVQKAEVGNAALCSKCQVIVSKNFLNDYTTNLRVFPLNPQIITLERWLEFAGVDPLSSVIMAHEHAPYLRYEVATHFKAYEYYEYFETEANVLTLINEC